MGVAKETFACVDSSGWVMCGIGGTSRTVTNM